MERFDQVTRAAQLYYLHDLTMDRIALDLGVSRSSVSRMLKSARAKGIVEIQVNTSNSEHRIVDLLRTNFGTTMHTVPVLRSSSSRDRLFAVAGAGAELLREYVVDDTTLAVAWGTTTAALSRVIVPLPRKGATVVQLNGAGNSSASGHDYASDIVSTLARAFDARADHFPVPAFFDYAATKDAMWRERSILRVLAAQRRASVALFSVGSVAGGIPSRVYANGYLERTDFQALDNAGVVGDVCTVFLRADGSSDKIDLNNRASGPAHETLRTIQTRICVATGLNKVPAILGALRAGLITDLILDEVTVEGLERALTTGSLMPAR